MKRLLPILITVFTFCVSTVFSQNGADSPDLKTFWNESVEPLVANDKERIKSIVEFPLGGDWGFMMGLSKDPKEWTKKDFYENFEILFDDRIIDFLKELDYKDADIVETGSGLTEILVGIGWKEEAFESGIIFRYKKIDGTWKLYIIQGAG